MGGEPNDAGHCDVDAGHSDVHRDDAGQRERERKELQSAHPADNRNRGKEKWKEER